MSTVMAFGMQHLSHRGLGVRGEVLDVPEGVLVTHVVFGFPVDDLVVEKNLSGSRIGSVLASEAVLGVREGELEGPTSRCPRIREKELVGPGPAFGVREGELDVSRFGFRFHVGILSIPRCNGCRFWGALGGHRARRLWSLASLDASGRPTGNTNRPPWLPYTSSQRTRTYTERRADRASLGGRCRNGGGEAVAAARSGRARGGRRAGGGRGRLEESRWDDGGRAGDLSGRDGGAASGRARAGDGGEGADADELGRRGPAARTGGAGRLERGRRRRRPSRAEEGPAAGARGDRSGRGLRRGGAPGWFRDGRSGAGRRGSSRGERERRRGWRRSRRRWRRRLLANGGRRWRRTARWRSEGRGELGGEGSPGARERPGRDCGRRKEDIRKIKEDEKLKFAAQDPSFTGKGAKAVFRDKEGRRINQEDIQKAKGDEKPKEKHIEWGKGLVQKRAAEARVQDLEDEKSKPFARSRDDPELDSMLKNRLRWGDPMAHLVKRKEDFLLDDLGDDEKMKESGFIVPQNVPTHSWLKRGVDPPLNRYGIKPGRHWDGVDRSNGYEKDMYKLKNDKQAMEQEAYLWSVADM